MGGAGAGACAGAAGCAGALVRQIYGADDEQRHACSGSADDAAKVCSAVISSPVVSSL